MTNIETQTYKPVDSNGDPRLSGTALVAGDLVKIHTDGTIIKVAAAEATNCIGIVYTGVAISKPVNVIYEGVVVIPFLIEDTDGSSGYDKAIVSGDLLVISGKTAGTYLPGQAVSAVGGTAEASAVAGMVVGKALDADAGSTSADTYGTMQAYVNFMN